MAEIKIKGDISGSTTIKAPDSGSDEIIELSTVLTSKLDLAGGKILQIVRATDTTNRTTTSTSFVDVSGMSVTITPQKSDSAVLILVSGQARLTIAGDGETGRFAVTDNSDNVISGAEAQSFGAFNYARVSGVTATFRVPLFIAAYATPATTSAVTYKLRFSTGQSTNATCALDGATNTSQMYAIEVSA